MFLDATGLPVTKEALNDVLERRAITLGQYDTIVTAPMYGFKDALDYYIKISSSRVVSRIRIPCLAINSGDDPIIGPDCIPLQLACVFSLNSIMSVLTSFSSLDP